MQINYKIAYIQSPRGPNKCIVYNSSEQLEVCIICPSIIGCKEFEFITLNRGNASAQV
jgi:hypothetical protein